MFHIFSRSVEYVNQNCTELTPTRKNAKEISMSSTVAKALAILDHFSEEEPEIGLSDLARRSGIDKATVHRMLSVMADAGLVEQRGSARLYRLGASVLRLARVRETSFPVSSIYQAAIDVLSDETGETAHASLVSGRALATIGISETTRGSRVSLIAGEILPFHSTASGLSALAYGPAELKDRLLSTPLEARTSLTVTDPVELQQVLGHVREAGFSESDQGNEDDVYGIAAPVFDTEGLATGAVAVATPAHRMTADLRRQIIVALLREAEKVTVGTGGKPPAGYAKAVAQTRDRLAEATG
jgi:DNA-binding IclR family transcriptional regulator